MRYNKSDYITRIPEDLSLLDPLITAETICKRIIDDYSLEQNKVQIAKSQFSFIKLLKKVHIKQKINS